MMSTKKTDFITGDGRPLNVDDIADAYRNVVNLSLPEAGKIQRLATNNYSLTCHFKTTDCDVLETVKTCKVYSLNTASRKEGCDRYIESVRCLTDPHARDELLVASSENGRFSARLRKHSEKKQLLEIWERSRLIKTIDMSELECHGLINTDPVFASFQWYPFGEQDKLIYVCQQKRPTYQSFFKQSVANVDGDNEPKPTGKLINLGHDFDKQEDWGECLGGIEHTIVAMLDVGANCGISTLDEPGSSLADVKWLEGMRTVSVAYREEPRRLGLVHCNNRPSSLLVHDWSSSKAAQVLELTSDTHCFKSPRVSNTGRKFVYLVSELYGPHFQSVRLHLYDLDTREDLELADKEQVADHFILGLNNNCFSTNDMHILFVRTDHLYRHLCLLNLESRELTRIRFPTTSVEVLDFRYNIILALGSEVNATPTLFVGVLDPADSGELIAWHQMEDCIHLDELDYKPYQIATSDNSTTISGLLITPNLALLHKNFVRDPKQLESGQLAGSDLPTVVAIHGGPHSAFLVSYMSDFVFHTRLGLKSLLINYRGSTGVSPESLKSLCGQIGRFDVEDCMTVVKHFVSEKLINPNKLIVHGGSHGGFLSCHLSCQDEFKFTSAIIRNPVVDLSTMHANSDTPDWIYAEGLGRTGYDASWQPGSEEWSVLFRNSPMSKYRSAHVPTLMLLGSQDRRVPMFQGERWVELLKARGVRTQCKVYADNHALRKAGVDADSRVTAAMWMLDNLQP